MQGVECSIIVGQDSLFEIFMYTTFTKIVLLLYVYRRLSQHYVSDKSNLKDGNSCKNIYLKNPY